MTCCCRVCCRGRWHSNQTDNDLFHIARIAAFLWRGNDSLNRPTATLQGEIKTTHSPAASAPLRRPLPLQRRHLRNRLAPPLHQNSGRRAFRPRAVHGAGLVVGVAAPSPRPSPGGRGSSGAAERLHSTQMPGTIGAAIDELTCDRSAWLRRRLFAGRSKLGRAQIIGQTLDRLESA